MRALALLNCGLYLFLFSDLKLSYQQRDDSFALVLLIAMVILLFINFFSLRDDRRLPLWVTLPYALFVVGLGLMVLLGYSAEEPYWYTFALFAIGCVCVTAGTLLAITQRRSSWEADSSIHTE